MSSGMLLDSQMFISIPTPWTRMSVHRRSWPQTWRFKTSTISCSARSGSSAGQRITRKTNQFAPAPIRTADVVNDRPSPASKIGPHRLQQHESVLLNQRDMRPTTQFQADLFPRSTRSDWQASVHPPKRRQMGSTLSGPRKISEECLNIACR